MAPCGATSAAASSVRATATRRRTWRGWRRRTPSMRPASPSTTGRRRRCGRCRRWTRTATGGCRSTGCSRRRRWRPMRSRRRARRAARRRRARGGGGAPPAAAAPGACRRSAGMGGGGGQLSGAQPRRRGGHGRGRGGADAARGARRLLPSGHGAGAGGRSVTEVRKENQDAYFVHGPFTSQAGQLLLGVFDGHGAQGRPVAHLVRDAIPVALEKARHRAASPTASDHSSSSGDTMALRAPGGNGATASPTGGAAAAAAPNGRSKKKLPPADDGARADIHASRANALRAAFTSAEAVVRRSGVDHVFSGTTAVVAWLFGSEMYVAWVGDSRCSVGRAITGGAEAGARRVAPTGCPRRPRRPRRRGAPRRPPRQPRRRAGGSASAPSTCRTTKSRCARMRRSACATPAAASRGGGGTWGRSACGKRTSGCRAWP
ncbi:hypothetical protein BU14_0532s0011 [Porphyra umbilicalis]|uniref:PPM-type phosphatase domain-containing protein n=1 Tax=Porphyra umbilicalis TaxID=2786 RepID=A0A1X6NS60_PORUM|nr:hypothetical protein BU14_0532s0011 [Porphyra umbilicalis]|eukprot:OSX71451.1 hypothetical protein BU14_0532s0011 [Porphyra umbilicalis]